MANNLTQWRVVSDGYRETFDNETEARRSYGRVRRAIKEDEAGEVTLYGRSSVTSDWIFLQEFVLGETEEEDDDE